MKNFKFCFVLALVAIFFSCENNNISDLPEKGMKLDLSDIEINIDFTSEFDLNEVTIDYVVNIVAEELFSDDFVKQLQRNNPTSIKEYAEGFTITINENLVTIEPIIQTFNESTFVNEELWNLHGTCLTQSCLEDMIKEFAGEIQGQHVNEICVNFIIKRTSAQADVFARYIEC